MAGFGGAVDLEVPREDGQVLGRVGSCGCGGRRGAGRRGRGRRLGGWPPDKGDDSEDDEEEKELAGIHLDVFEDDGFFGGVAELGFEVHEGVSMLDFESEVESDVDEGDDADEGLDVPLGACSSDVGEEDEEEEAAKVVGVALFDSSQCLDQCLHS